MSDDLDLTPAERIAEHTGRVEFLDSDRFPFKLDRHHYPPLECPTCGRANISNLCATCGKRF